ncbi:hypothetical protein CB1_000977010, partial [Camelus ferus]
MGAVIVRGVRSASSDRRRSRLRVPWSGRRFCERSWLLGHGPRTSDLGPGERDVSIIHIIDFDDENNIISKNVLLHQVGEIWHISASPADRGVLATCYNRRRGQVGLRWRLSCVCRVCSTRCVCSMSCVCRVCRVCCMCRMCRVCSVSRVCSGDRTSWTLSSCPALRFCKFHVMPASRCGGGEGFGTRVCPVLSLGVTEILPSECPSVCPRPPLLPNREEQRRREKGTCSWEAGVRLWSGAISTDGISPAPTLRLLVLGAADSKVLTCAAVWRMPAELEPGGHESPEDAASPAHALELLCHLDHAARGSTACAGAGAALGTLVPPPAPQRVPGLAASQGPHQERGHFQRVLHIALVVPPWRLGLASLLPACSASDSWSLGRCPCRRLAVDARLAPALGC